MILVRSKLYFARLGPYLHCAFAFGSCWCNLTDFPCVVFLAVAIHGCRGWSPGSCVDSLEAGCLQLPRGVVCRGWPPVSVLVAIGEAVSCLLVLFSLQSRQKSFSFLYRPFLCPIQVHSPLFMPIWFPHAHLNPV